MWVTWDRESVNIGKLQTLQLELNRSNLLDLIGYRGNTRICLLDNSEHERSYTIDYGVMEELLQDIIKAAAENVVTVYKMSEGVALAHEEYNKRWDEAHNE